MQFLGVKFQPPNPLPAVVSIFSFQRPDLFIS